MKRFYIAIADVHGMADRLNEKLMICDGWIHLQKRLGNISIEDEVQFIFLGDLIDRGPSCNRVIDIVQGRVNDGAILLYGNHDMFLVGSAEGRMMGSEFGDDPYVTNSYKDVWLFNDGIKTCKQMFGNHKNSIDECIDDIKASRAYDLYTKHAKLMHETDLIFFSHAPQSNVKEISEHTLLWARERDYDHPNVHNLFKVPFNKKISVHGHMHNHSNFPRIFNYVHGGIPKTVVLADSGSGCFPEGTIHPVVLRETLKRDGHVKNEADIVAIL